MTDYKKIHGHERCKVGSIEWHFHNYEHGYKHCKGSRKYPYSIKHIIKNKKLIHVIDKKQAKGHGYKEKPTLFEFPKKIGKQGWDLSSGVKLK